MHFATLVISKEGELKPPPPLPGSTLAAVEHCAIFNGSSKGEYYSESRAYDDLILLRSEEEEHVTAKSSKQTESKM